MKEEKITIAAVVDRDKHTSFFLPFQGYIGYTICIFHSYQVPIGLVYSIDDPTEIAIQKMIEASQTMITHSSQGELGRLNLL